MAPSTQFSAVWRSFGPALGSRDTGPRRATRMGRWFRSTACSGSSSVCWVLLSVPDNSERRLLGGGLKGAAASLVALARADPAWMMVAKARPSCLCTSQCAWVALSPPQTADSHKARSGCPPGVNSRVSCSAVHAHAPQNRAATWHWNCLEVVCLAGGGNGDGSEAPLSRPVLRRGVARHTTDAQWWSISRYVVHLVACRIHHPK